MSDLKATRQEAKERGVEEFSIHIYDTQFTVFAKYDGDDYEPYWIYAGDQEIGWLVNRELEREILDLVYAEGKKEAEAMKIDEAIYG